MTEKSIITDDTRILIWELTESIDELLGLLKLTGLEVAECEKFTSTKRKLEYLGVRIALKKLLGDDVIICYNAEGKPSLSNNKFQISISHSNRWIAVMAHPTRPVGIDIERPSDKIQKLYTRFLSKTEQEELSDGKDNRQLQLAWSAKEALYKIIGKEAIDFAHQLRIFPFEVKTEGNLTALHVPTNTLYQLSYFQSPAYTLVYCLV